MADDIFLDKGAVSAHMASHERHPEREYCVMGPVAQHPELFEMSTFLRHWEQFGFVDLGEEAELPYYWFWGHNVSFKTDFMIEYGMFLEHRGRAGAPAHETEKPCSQPRALSACLPPRKKGRSLM